MYGKSIGSRYVLKSQMNVKTDIKSISMDSEISFDRSVSSVERMCDSMDANPSLTTNSALITSMAATLVTTTPTKVVESTTNDTINEELIHSKPESETNICHSMKRKAMEAKGDSDIEELSPTHDLPYNCLFIKCDKQFQHYRQLIDHRLNHPKNGTDGQRYIRKRDKQHFWTNANQWMTNRRPFNNLTKRETNKRDWFESNNKTKKLKSSEESSDEQNYETIETTNSESNIKGKAIVKNRSDRETFKWCRCLVGTGQKTWPLQTKHKDLLNGKLCILSSGLGNKYRDTIQHLCLKLNADFVNEWSNKVTHLVIELAQNRPKSELICPRNAKYLKALLNNKWIVSFDWIKDSYEWKRFKSEKDYEIRADRLATEANIPQFSRMTEIKLFENLMFCFDGNFNKRLNEFKDFVSIGGGIVVNSMEEFEEKRTKDREKLIIVTKKLVSANTQNNTIRYIDKNSFLSSMSDFKNL